MIAPRGRLSRLLLAAIACALAVAGSGGAGEPDLDDAVRALFNDKGFAPTMLPNRRSTLKDLDPLLVQAQWELVRPALEKLYERRLKLDDPPDLRLKFLCVNDPDWKNPQQVRVVFIDPGSEAVRRSLLATLGLPKRSFELRDSALAAKTELVYLKATKEAAKVMNFGAVEKLLAEVLEAEKGSKLTPLQTTVSKDNTGLQAYSRWVFLREAPEPRPQLFYWRVSFTLQKVPKDKELDANERELERWLLRTVVEIGRKTPGAPEVQAIENTDTSANFAEWLSVTLKRPPDQAGTYRDERGGTVRYAVARQGNGDEAYYTEEKEGVGARLVTQSPLAQAASRVFNASQDRIVKTFGWWK